jgi:hypothetical protein
VCAKLRKFKSRPAHGGATPEQFLFHSAIEQNKSDNCSDYDYDAANED